MVTKKIINKPNLAINRLSVGVDDRKKWASREKRARAAKNVREQRKNELAKSGGKRKALTRFFWAIFYPCYLHFLRARSRPSQIQICILCAWLTNSVITCLWQEVWQLCKTNVSIVLVPLSFLLLRFMISRKVSRHFPQQSNAEPRPIVPY